MADHPAPNKQRAALTLGCTVRHINRMLYKEHGTILSMATEDVNQPIPSPMKLVILFDLYRNKYYDANFEHFTELLGKHEANQS